jgi:mannosyltransferase
LLPSRGRPGQAATAPAGPEPQAPWRRRGGISLPSVAAPLLLAPAAILALESFVARPLYVDRYVLYGEAGAALLAGAGVHRIGRWLGEAAGRRPLICVPGVAVCLCALLLQLAPQQRARAPQSRLFDFGGPSRYLGAHAQRGDGVLFFTSFYRKARLGYPADFRKVSDFAMAVPPVRAGNFQGRNKPFKIIGPLMLEHRRIWVIGTIPSLRQSPGRLREESRVLLDRFSLMAKRHFRNITVTLWLRR